MILSFSIVVVKKLGCRTNFNIKKIWVIIKAGSCIIERFSLEKDSLVGPVAQLVRASGS